MLEMRRQIRSGDIWVKFSNKYSSLESLLVPEDNVDIESLGVGSCFTDYLCVRQSRDLFKNFLSLVGVSLRGIFIYLGKSGQKVGKFSPIKKANPQ